MIDKNESQDGKIRVSVFLTKPQYEGFRKFAFYKYKGYSSVSAHLRQSAKDYLQKNIKHLKK